MAFVIDASVVLASLLGEERATEADAMLALISPAACVVPGHWRLEIANVLTRDVRRKRLSAEEAGCLAVNADSLDPMVDDETDAASLQATTRLSLAHLLTAYDAAYLELALRRGADLATFDLRLADAAEERGIHLLLPKVKP